MIRLRLTELLEERERTMYWLAKESGVRYATVWKLANGDHARLTVDSLDRICEALECQPGDLIVKEEAQKGLRVRRRCATKSRRKR